MLDLVLAHRGYSSSDSFNNDALLEVAEQLADAMGEPVPRIIPVRSKHQRIQVVRVGGESAILWDEGYVQLFAELLEVICVGVDDLENLYGTTEKILLGYVGNLLNGYCLAEGKHDLSELLPEGDWERLVGIWAERNMGPFFWAMSADTIERIRIGIKLETVQHLSRDYFKDLSSIGCQRVINTQLTSIFAMILAHEMAHIAFERDSKTRATYSEVVRSEIGDFLNDPFSYSLDLSCIAAGSIVLSASSNGFEYGRDGRDLTSNVLVPACAEVLESAELFEEVCSDWYAIDAWWKMQSTKGVSFLSLAELEQVVSLSHQYCAWLGFLRFDTLLHLDSNREPPLAEALKGQRIRGILKMVKMAQVKKTLTKDQRKDLAVHRIQIRWLELMVESQIFVFARLDEQLDWILHILNGRPVSLRMVMDGLFHWLGQTSYRLAEIHWLLGRVEAAKLFAVEIEAIGVVSCDAGVRDWVVNLARATLSLSDDVLPQFLPKGISLSEAREALRFAAFADLPHWTWWTTPFRISQPQEYIEQLLHPNAAVQFSSWAPNFFLGSLLDLLAEDHKALTG